MSRGEAAAAAAAVSQLLGGRSAEKVLAAARRSFSYVSADKLLREDMADSNPNPALARLTSKGRLSHVDAFVSHSWHDCKDLKWTALQKWRDTFKQKNNGREPNLWIDKYNIDQTQIDSSLACLPVYLAGCRRLLILCGNTYLKRLWCLIEIFVFVQMGGKMDNLEVVFLEEQLRSSSSTHISLADQIESFDPRDAQCFSDYDNDRLHAVFGAAGYGQVEELVKSAFGQHLNTDSCA